MPTYRSLKTSVVLKVVEVGPTVTLLPTQHTRTRRTAEYGALDQALSNGTQLKERPAPPPSMSGFVNFIGDDEQFPFLMVHAGADLFQPQASERSSAVEAALAKLQAIRDRKGGSVVQSTDTAQGGGNLSSSVVPKKNFRKYDSMELQLRSVRLDSSPLSSVRSVATPRHTPGSEQDPRSTPERPLQSQSASIAAEFLDKVPKENDILLTPMALAAVIDISKDAFSTPVRGGKTAQDIKIEVFINGELAECMACAGPRLQGDHQQVVIHGRRVSRGLNRPWIIIPSSQTAEGTLIQQPRKYVAPEVRWQLIANALAQEADGRGVDDDGHRAPSAEYFRALSQMGVPAEVYNMSKSNPISSNRFGVIDVVLTLGTRKPTTSVKWAYEPDRLPDSRYSVKEMQPELENEPAPHAGNPSYTGDITMANAVLPQVELVKPKPADVNMDEAPSTGIPTPQSFIFAPPALPASVRGSFRRRRSDAIGSDISGHPSRPTSATSNRAEDFFGISRRGIIRRGSKVSLQEADTPASPTAPAGPLQQLAPMNVRSIVFSLGERVVLQSQLSQPQIFVRSSASMTGAEQVRPNLICPLSVLPTLRTLEQSNTAPSSSQIYGSPSQQSLQSSPAQPAEPTQSLTAAKPRLKPNQQPRSSASPTQDSSPTKPAPAIKSRRATSMPGPGAAASANLTWMPGPLTKASVVSYALPGPYIKGIAEGSKSIVGGVNADGSPCGVYRYVRTVREGGFAEAEVLVGFRFLVG